MGWGQVGQHRSFGHKGGLGRSGHLKHLWSTVIKEDQDHFGHESTHRPASVSIITKKWVSVRDLDDLFTKSGKSENSKNILDLTSLEIDIETTKQLLDKKARKSGYKKVTDEDITAIGFESVDELASALTEGKATLSKLKPLKPWFALDPPRHGFKRSTKRLYGQKGVLGYNKELSVIVKRMM